MKESALHALQHAIHQSDPLSPGEIKEAFFRHVLSNRDNKAARETTYLLMALYVEVSRLRSGVEVNLLSASVASDAFINRFLEGFREIVPNAEESIVDQFEWPLSIGSHLHYPAALISEVAWLLGRQSAESLTNKSSGSA